MRAYRLISFAGLLGMMLSLAACDASTPSLVYTGKLRVREQMVVETLAADKLDSARVREISKNILKRGRSDVTITVPYATGGEPAAKKQGDSYKQAFEKQGVTHVSTVLVPVADSRDADEVIVGYEAVEAVSGNGCNRIPGYQGAENIEAVDQYRLGCETQAVLAKMVADPTDLLGKSSTHDGDSRRSSALMDPYMSGTANKPLEGMKASDIGTK